MTARSHRIRRPAQAILLPEIEVQWLSDDRVQPHLTRHCSPSSENGGALVLLEFLENVYSESNPALILCI